MMTENERSTMSDLLDRAYHRGLEDGKQKGSETALTAIADFIDCNDCPAWEHCDIDGCYEGMKRWFAEQMKEGEKE